MGAQADWNPETYARFRGLRLRPALDLLMQVGELPVGDVVDLGCGDGAAAASLRTRFHKRRVLGVDASPAMLDVARGYHATQLADIAIWAPDAPPALIFSNAALQWLPDHATLLPRLASLLAPGGTLAVQMPGQHDASSHRLLRELAGTHNPAKVAGWAPPVAAPATYARILAPLGDASVWETTYLQRLAPVAEGHPVRHFTQSTAMRPFVAGLTAVATAAFVAAYDAALQDAYPAEADGSVLFPFRRVFMVLRHGN